MPSNKIAALALSLVVAAAATFVFAQDVVITPDPTLAALSHEEMVVKRRKAKPIWPRAFTSFMAKRLIVRWKQSIRR